ncbi:MAG: DsbC family protein [Gammaproteobacteria bacterium]|nr:DsbC family protein [Gammaproteobacteria bacterium]
MKSSILTAVLLLSTVLSLAQAQPPESLEPEAEGVALLRAALMKKMPNLPVKSIAETPVKGIYEVLYGSQVAYLSQDARYMFDGDLVDLHSSENLTEVRRSEGRLAALEAVGEDRMLVFSPKESQHTITVFTDVDCGYCRKLHKEIAELNKAGVKVRYLLYSRAGVGSDSYNTMVSAWCADDPKAALTTAKLGGKIEARQCDNPVKQHMAVGRALGLRGTPMIILDDGSLIAGYQPAAQLIATLNKK